MWRRVALVFLFSSVLMAQNVRWDWSATTTLSTSGSLVPIMGIVNAGISFYINCTSLPCSEYATTYTNSSITTACPNNAQVVLQNQSTCQSTSDSQGNFGGWFPTGQSYQYTITYNNNVYGPYNFTINGGGSGTVAGQAASTVPLGTGPTEIGNQSHLNEATVGWDSFTQPVALPGVNDTTGGLPVQPMLLKPTTGGGSTCGSNVGGGTDMASYFAQQNICDYQAGYQGRYYKENTPAGTNQTFAIATLWNPALTAVGSPNSTMAIVTELAQVVHYTPGTLNVPSYTTLRCAAGGGSTTVGSGQPGNGCVIAPIVSGTTANFQLLPYVSGTPTGLLNQGHPSGTGGSTFDLNSAIIGPNLNCLGIPTMAGVTNWFTQQGGIVRDLEVTSCQYGYVRGQQGNSGGSQNVGETRNVQVALPAQSTNIVMSKINVVTGGTGITTASISVTGCGTAPQFIPVIVAGAISFIEPNSTYSNPFGVCANPSAVSVNLTTNGSGATVAPEFESFAPPEGFYLETGAGGGTQAENSIVGGKYAQNNSPCAQDEAGLQLWMGEYRESCLYGLSVDVLQTAGISGDLIFGLKTSSANEPMQAMLYNAEAGPVGYVAAGVGGSAFLTLSDNGQGGAQIPSEKAGFVWGGNGSSLTFLARSPADEILTVEQNLGSNIEPSVLMHQATSSPALPGYGVANVGGYAQLVPTSAVTGVRGVATAQCQTQASHSSACMIAYNGKAPGFWDGSSLTAGDVAIPSTTTPGALHDTGYASIGAWLNAGNSGFAYGNVADDGSAGVLSLPAAMSCASCGYTITGTAASTSVEYYAAAATYADFTLGQATNPLTITNGPAAIVGSSININTLPSAPTSQTAMFREGLTDTLPTVVAHCNPTSGMFDYLTYSGSQSSIWFVPKVSSWAGGGGTNPTVTLIAAGGQLVTWTFGSYGANCTGNATATLTDSTCNNGFIGYTSGATTFSDTGRCAIAYPGQTVQTAPTGQLMARVDLQPAYYPGATAGVPSINGNSGAYTINGNISQSGNTITVLGGATVTSNAGDLVCAHAADTTIASATITAGGATSLTLSGPGTSYWLPGVLVGVTGATPTGLNGGPYTVTSRSSSTLNFSSLPATWASGGTVFLWCSNQGSDATSATYFTNNTYAISSYTANEAWLQKYMMNYWSSTTASTVEWYLKYGSTTLWQQTSATTPASGRAGLTGEVDWLVAAPNASSATNPIFNTLISEPLFGAAWTSLSSNVNQPVSVGASGTLEMGLAYTAAGIGIPTYSSGGTFTGTGACVYDASGGGGTGGVLNVNVSSGTFSSFTINNTGYAYTSEPTSWTYVSGSACSTSITTTGGALGGAQGNAFLLPSLSTLQTVQ